MWPGSEALLKGKYADWRIVSSPCRTDNRNPLCASRQTWPDCCCSPLSVSKSIQRAGRPSTVASAMRRMMSAFEPPMECGHQLADRGQRRGLGALGTIGGGIAGILHFNELISAIGELPALVHAGSYADLHSALRGLAGGRVQHAKVDEFLVGRPHGGGEHHGPLHQPHRLGAQLRILRWRRVGPQGGGLRKAGWDQQAHGRKHTVGY